MPAVEQGILPGGITVGLVIMVKDLGADPGGKMPPSPAGKDACRYGAGADLWFANRDWRFALWRMKFRSLVRLAVTCSLVIAASALVARSQAAAQRPNIVFILADDLGYTDVACYGSKYYETPNIDRLAANGIRFTSGYTCGPNCAPTRAALMSGQYGPRTGVYTVGSIERFDWRSRPLRPVDNVTQLPLSKITIAQSLKKAGYATAMFGKWHLGDGGDYHPSQRGFDEAIVSAGRILISLHIRPWSIPRAPTLRIS